MNFSQKIPLYFFYTMVQKSQKRPKTQIKGSCLNACNLGYGISVHESAIVVMASMANTRKLYARYGDRVERGESRKPTVDSISYVLFFVWKNQIARLSDSLQIFRRALLWSHLFPTVWMSSLAQKIMGFLGTRLSLPRIFGRFEWKIENKKYT